MEASGGKFHKVGNTVGSHVTAMLIGEYQHTIDPKGRVIVPSKFREDLGELFYVTKGLDGCLFVLSPVEWDKLQEYLAGLN